MNNPKDNVKSTLFEDIGKQVRCLTFIKLNERKGK